MIVRGSVVRANRKIPPRLLGSSRAQELHGGHSPVVPAGHIPLRPSGGRRKRPAVAETVRASCLGCSRANILLPAQRNARRQLPQKALSTIGNRVSSQS